MNYRKWLFVKRPSDIRYNIVTLEPTKNSAKFNSIFCLQLGSWVMTHHWWVQSSSSGLDKGLWPPLQVKFTWKGLNLGAPEAAPIRWRWHWNKKKLIWSLQYLIWITSLLQNLNLITKLFKSPRWELGPRDRWVCIESTVAVTVLLFVENEPL